MQINSSKLLFPTSVIAVAIVAVVGGFYFLNQPPETQPTPTPVPTPTPSGKNQINTETEAKLQELGLAMNDVKLYRNEELGFEFLYPVIEEDNDVEIITNVDVKTPIGDYDFLLQYCTLIDCNFGVRLFGEKNPASDIHTLADNYFAEGWKKSLVTQEIVSIGEIESLQSSFKTTQNDDAGINQIEVSKQYTQFIRNGILYTFYLSGADPIYQDVFRISFRFLQ